MGISKYYSTEVDVYRLSAVANSKREEFALLTAGILCHIQQGSPRDSTFGSSGGFYSEFTAWFPAGTNIEVGDKIVLGDDSANYKVQGKKVVDFGIGSGAAHIELSIVKGK